MERNLMNKMESMAGAKALMVAMEKEGVKQGQDMNSQLLIWLMGLAGLVENPEFVLLHPVQALLTF
jgi:hypothetical protein